MEHWDHMLRFSLLHDQTTAIAFHTGLTVFFALTGSPKIKVQQEYTLTPPALLVLQPFSFFQAVCSETVSLLVLEVSEEMLALARWSAFQTVFVCTDSPETAAVHRDLSARCAENFQEFFEKKRFSRAHAAVQMLFLLENLKKQLISSEEPPTSCTVEDMEHLQNILNHIHEHWREKPTLAALAKKEFLSASTLSRQFQLCFGITPERYRNQLRKEQEPREAPAESVPFDRGISKFLQYAGKTAEDISIKKETESVTVSCCGAQPAFSRQKSHSAVICRLDRDKKQAIKISVSLSDLRYRIARDQLQGYYELSFAPIKDELISEIIIGPKSLVQEEDIYLFLAAYGYHEKEMDNKKHNQFIVDNINVCTSELSYR